LADFFAYIYTLRSIDYENTSIQWAALSWNTKTKTEAIITHRETHELQGNNIEDLVQK